MGVTGQGERRFKRLPSLVTVLVLLALLCIIWSVPVFAQIWESYQDSGHKTVWGTVANPYDSNYSVAYVYGTGFINGQAYNIGYYDGNGDLVGTDNNVIATTGAGKLESLFDLAADPSAAAGTWYSSVYQDPATPPSTYAGDGVANDDFEVLAEAIPEFPTVMAAIIVAGLCFGAYYWMRKRQLAYVKV